MTDINVSSLVTVDLLKQAISTTAVQNALRDQVLQLLCEQINAAVGSAVSSLTVSVSADDSESIQPEQPAAGKEIDTSGNTDDTQSAGSQDDNTGTAEDEQKEEEVAAGAGDAATAAKTTGTVQGVQGQNISGSQVKPQQ